MPVIPAYEGIQKQYLANKGYNDVTVGNTSNFMKMKNPSDT